MDIRKPVSELNPETRYILGVVNALLVVGIGSAIAHSVSAFTDSNTPILIAAVTSAAAIGVFYMTHSRFVPPRQKNKHRAVIITLIGGLSMSIYPLLMESLQLISPKQSEYLLFTFVGVFPGVIIGLTATAVYIYALESGDAYNFADQADNELSGND